MPWKLGEHKLSLENKVENVYTVLIPHVGVILTQCGYPKEPSTTLIHHHTRFVHEKMPHHQ